MAIEQQNGDYDLRDSTPATILNKTATADCAVELEIRVGDGTKDLDAGVATLTFEITNNGNKERITILKEAGDLRIERLTRKYYVVNTKPLVVTLASSNSADTDVDVTVTPRWCVVADSLGSVVLANAVHGGAEATLTLEHVTIDSSNSGGAVDIDNDSGPAINISTTGDSCHGVQVEAQGSASFGIYVLGSTTGIYTYGDFYGIRARSASGAGIVGESTHGDGIVGVSTIDGNGIRGETNSESDNAAGIMALGHDGSHAILAWADGDGDAISLSAADGNEAPEIQAMIDGVWTAESRTVTDKTGFSLADIDGLSHSQALAWILAATSGKTAIDEESGAVAYYLNDGVTVAFTNTYGTVPGHRTARVIE